MSKKSISMCQGKGSLSHNNRVFTAKNIDSSRTADNIIFVRQDLGEAYQQLFDEAIDRYNARQKRNDRKIADYFQHLFNREPSSSVIEGTNKQKSFYEHLVYIGTRNDTGVGTPDAEIAIACLREYMEGFQARNPNLYVFNAVMHLDEATPHLHIDYIPIGHFKNGVEVRNAKAKALEELGFGKGEKANDRWRLREWEVLRQICESHGIEISEPKKSRGYSYTVEEYGEYQDTIRELEAEKAQIIAERDEARAELDKVAKKKVKLTEIDNVETGKTVFGGKITVSQEDWDHVTALAKKEVASQKQTKKLKLERDEAVQERDAIKAKYDAVAEELATYKKKEESKRYLSREKLHEETVRVSDREKLRKAMAFIDACGLRSDYQKFRYNSTVRKNDLE